jgi:hypothetical protein
VAIGASQSFGRFYHSPKFFHEQLAYFPGLLAHAPENSGSALRRLIE